MKSGINGSRMTLQNAVILILIASLLSACNTNTITRRVLGFNSLSDLSSTPVPVMPTEPASAPAGLTTSTAAAVLQRGMLKVGIRYDAPPLASITDKGELQGMDVDIAREFAQRWLGDASRISFVQVTSLSAPRRVKNREVDLALGGLSVARVLEPDIDFSLPYASDGEALLIRTNSYPDLASMNGKEVYYIDAQSLPRFNLAQQSAGVTVSVKSEVSYPNALNALLTNQTEGLLGRTRRLQLIGQRDPAYQVLTVFSREPQAIMLPQNDSGWADLVNITLSNMVIDGTYAKIYQKWWGAPPEAIGYLPGKAQPKLGELSPTLAPKQVYDQMRIGGQMRVGYALPSGALAQLVQLDEGGQPTGLEADLVRELSRRLLQNDGNAQFFALQPNQIAQQLAEGRIDLAIGAIQRTQENERIMDFSSPTADSGIAQLNGQLAAPTGIALAIDDSALRDALSLALDDMKTDGTYDALRAKWFP